MYGWFNFLGWLLSIATVAGNAFVISLIVKQRRLHSSANWLVLSLAVADSGVGVAIFPVGYFCSEPASCNMRVYMAFHWLLVHSSATNLCVLTWDRYTAIVRPFKYPSCMTAKRPGIVILFAWLIPFVISSALVLGMYATNSLTAWKILRLTGVSAFDMLVCMLLIYGVTRVLFVARAKARDDLSAQNCRGTSAQQPQNDLSNKSVFRWRRNKHNTALFIIAIVTFFLGCHIVINYLVLCKTFCSDVSDLVSLILILLLILNSAANPVVYALCKPDVERELKKLCRRKAMA